MEIKVKLVVFEHPNPTEWHRYCSYCPELKYFFGRGETIEEVVVKVKHNTYRELQLRNVCTNLIRRNWTISENSVIPPIFTEDEAIELTKKSYELQQLVNVKIFELHVEVPKAFSEW